jgi:hypothetical protein
MMRVLLIVGTLTAGGLICGCSDKLETGYEPRRLGGSAAERRAYYASPYTPEAIAAQRDNGTSAAPGGFRHPGD